MMNEHLPVQAACELSVREINFDFKKCCTRLSTGNYILATPLLYVDGFESASGRRPLTQNEGSFLLAEHYWMPHLNMFVRLFDLDLPCPHRISLGYH